MKSLGIVWNAAFEFRRQILQIISQFADIRSVEEIDMNEKYEEFVRTLYKSYNITDWKLDAKIKHMQKTNSTKICIILFDIDISLVKYHERKKRNVYVKLQDMKDLIRNTFKDKVIDYYFDTIFHCTDNETEYIDDLNTLISFFERNSSSVMKSSDGI